MLEADEAMINEMKNKVKKEYYSRVIKVLGRRLNSGNVSNTCAVSVLRYSAAFLGWSRLQVEDIYRRTRKLLTMHNRFHPKSNVNRLYLSRSEGSRGLIGIQDTVETAILGFKNYVRNRKERLLIAARTIEDDEDRETLNEYKKRKKNERETQWTQKQLHEQFIGQTMVEASEDQWGWLRKGCLKRITEALIMATLEQAVRTNNLKAKIGKIQGTVNVECVEKLKIL